MGNYDVVNVIIGNGSDVYNKHQYNNKELRRVISELIDIYNLLKSDNYKYGSYSRPVLIENCTNFLKSYNTRDLWMN